MTERPGIPDARELIREWQTPVYNYARYRVANEADAADLCQDIFLAALKGRRSLQDPRKLRSWLFAIAYRQVAAYHQRRSLRDEKEREAARSAGTLERADPLLAAEEAEQAALVQAELRGLPGELQDVLVLRYFQGLTQREVSAALGRPRTTVQSQIKKGLARLKVRLAAAGAATLVPEIEAVLRQLPCCPIPPSLERALAHLEPGSNPVTAGLLLKLNLVLVTTILILLCPGAAALKGTKAAEGRQARADGRRGGQRFTTQGRRTRRGARAMRRRAKDRLGEVRPGRSDAPRSESRGDGEPLELGESADSEARRAIRDSALASLFDRLVDLSIDPNRLRIEAGDLNDPVYRRFLKLRPVVQERHAELIQYAARRLEEARPRERAALLETLRLLLLECRPPPMDAMSQALDRLRRAAENLPPQEARAVLRLAAEASPPEERERSLPPVATLARYEPPDPDFAALPLPGDLAQFMVMQPRS